MTMCNHSHVLIVLLPHVDYQNTKDRYRGLGWLALCCWVTSPIYLFIAGTELLPQNSKATALDCILYIEKLFGEDSYKSGPKPRWVTCGFDFLHLFFDMSGDPRNEQRQVALFEILDQVVLWCKENGDLCTTSDYREIKHSG